MKKISFIATIVFTFLLASCSKDLNQIPISAQTTATFYQQPADFLQAVNATYNSLRGYPDRLENMSEIRSDNIYPTNAVARDPDPISNFSTSISGHTFVEEAWNTDYKGIFQANTVLDEISKNGTTVFNTPALTALATRLQAEARFLRAFMYFDLVRYYGKVPIIDHPVTPAESLSIPRAAVADVYTLIIADLQFAIANLPLNYAGAYPSYTTADVGRATKYAADAVLGEVYMTRSGPTYGIAGPGLGLNEWALAVPLFNDIINSGLFVFNPSYANIFSYTNQSPNYTATGNREAIFDMMFLTGQNPVQGTDFTWQLIPQNYFNSLGNTPLNGNLGTPSVSPNMLADYAAGDSRKAFNIFTAGYTYQGSLDPYPFFRKYVPYTGTGALDIAKIPASRFDWGINFIAIRYTDILMLKAECVINGAPGSQATDVDAVVNQVRTRAGIGTPALVNVTAAQLLDERRREFAAEGSRWFDLQRSGQLLTIMNAWEAVDDAALKKMAPVVANYIIYPVPLSQLNTAPGLYPQNPGY